VQFNFEHHLKEAEGQPAGSGTRVHTKVQIRPEHLGPHPTETPNKAQKALHTLHRILHTFKRPMEQPFGGKTALSYLRASVDPADIGNAAHRLFGSGTSGSGPGAPPAPTSDEAPSGGFGWRPHEMVPAWSNRVRGRAPSGTGIKVNQHDVDSPHIPLKDNHTARTAGGWAHYTEYGNFIPTGSPDIQEHIERVHQELAQKSPEERANFIQSHRGNASANTSGGGYFTQRGDYIPPVRALDNEQRAKHQRGWETRYGHEIGRRETQAAPAHSPLPFEPAKTSLAPVGSRQYEYDTGTPEQRAAAQRAAREDMRKSLFAPIRKSMFAVPKGFPVTRVPTVPHVPTLKWNIDKGVPSFGPAETAPNAQQSYLNGVVKSKLRHG